MQLGPMIGADEPRAGGAQLLAQPPLSPATVFAGLAEARADHEHRRHTACDAIVHRGLDRCRGHGDDREIDVGRYVPKARVGAHALH
jgi:hypothetical protein